MQHGQRHSVESRLKMSRAHSRRWSKRRPAVAALRKVASRHGEHAIEFSKT
jgi:hypothetical protein